MPKTGGRAAPPPSIDLLLLEPNSPRPRNRRLKPFGKNGSRLAPQRRGTPRHVEVRLSADHCAGEVRSPPELHRRGRGAGHCQRAKKRAPTVMEDRTVFCLSLTRNHLFRGGNCQLADPASPLSRPKPLTRLVPTISHTLPSPLPRLFDAFPAISCPKAPTRIRARGREIP